MFALGQKKSPLNKKQIYKSPETPGIYMFWNIAEKPIYVGKSNILKKRLSSYLNMHLLAKTAQMIKEAKFFSVVRTNSELEALLLEAKLVKYLKPKYNIQLKDDKLPLYIRITNEDYPQIITARRIDEEKKSLAFYGPFPSSSNVKSVLKMLRRIIPYAQHKVSSRACFYSQIGLCNPCPSIIEKEKDALKKYELKKLYKKNITLINKILSGKIRRVRDELYKNMEKLAHKEKYEEADILKNQIAKLDYITQPITPISEFIKNPNLFEDIKREEEKSLISLLEPFLKVSKLERIECFDVAHLAGTKPTASMVTFINGEPDKKLYRHFKIYQNKGNDDIASLKEVAQRRSKHFDDWGKSDLILVDGGKAQVGIFWAELKGYQIPIIGLAKRYETLVIPKPFRSKLAFKEIQVPRPALNLLQRIRNEAHRFARRLHHKLIEKEFRFD